MEQADVHDLRVALAARVVQRGATVGCLGVEHIRGGGLGMQAGLTRLAAPAGLAHDLGGGDHLDHVGVVAQRRVLEQQRELGHVGGRQLVAVLDLLEQLRREPQQPARLPDRGVAVLLEGAKPLSSPSAAIAAAASSPASLGEDEDDLEVSRWDLEVDLGGAGTTSAVPRLAMHAGGLGLVS
eukprot:scaffold119416_cov60-Phaeocystis_antarctica.AAC.1